jgi:hypothetical protein
MPVNLHLITVKLFLHVPLCIHTHIHTYLCVCVGFSAIMNFSNFLVIKNSVYKCILKFYPSLIKIF